MNENEGMLMAALMVIVRHVPDRGALAKDLREMADGAKLDSRKSEAANLEMLARIAEGDTFYRPSFPVIDGGKKD
jgi:hypothetical protein